MNDLFKRTQSGTFFQLYVIKFSSFYDFSFVCVEKLVLYVHIYHILQTITIRHTILGCGWGGGGGVGVYSKKTVVYKGRSI